MRTSVLGLVCAPVPHSLRTRVQEARLLTQPPQCSQPSLNLFNDLCTYHAHSSCACIIVCLSWKQKEKLAGTGARSLRAVRCVLCAVRCAPGASNACGSDMRSMYRSGPCSQCAGGHVADLDGCVTTTSIASGMVSAPPCLAAASCRRLQRLRRLCTDDCCMGLYAMPVAGVGHAARTCEQLHEISGGVHTAFI